jgi:hypothetical protein
MFVTFKSHYCNSASIKEAINEYNNVNKKGCRYTIMTGRKKTYVCLDPTCKFQLTFYVKRKTKGIRDSHIAQIPEGYWYVFKFIEHNHYCVSLPLQTAKTLAANTTFASAVLSQNNKLSNRVLKNILSQNVDEQQVTTSKINRAKKLIINNNETYVKNSYGDIASMLILLKK